MKKILFGVTLCALVCAAVQGAEKEPKKPKRSSSLFSFGRRKKKASKAEAARLKAKEKQAKDVTKVLEHPTWEDFEQLQKQIQVLRQQFEVDNQNVEKAATALLRMQEMVDGMRGEVRTSLDSLMSESNVAAQEQGANLLALMARVQACEDQQEELVARVQRLVVDSFVLVEKDLRCDGNGGVVSSAFTYSNEG